jgi:hypothetical protein
MSARKRSLIRCLLLCVGVSLTVDVAIRLAIFSRIGRTDPEAVPTGQPDDAQLQEIIRAKDKYERQFQETRRWLRDEMKEIRRIDERHQGESIEPLLYQPAEGGVGSVGPANARGISDTQSSRGI